MRYRGKRPATTGLRRSGGSWSETLIGERGPVPGQQLLDPVDWVVGDTADHVA